MRAQVLGKEPVRAVKVAIPGEISEVILRAHGKVHCLGGKEMRITLP